MALKSGTALGQCVIRAPLGAGGMGEVYLARDTRLDRDVAIKVLPASLTTDVERLRRFEQEARAAAALNHPNILSVHQMATENGVSYLVSELLEGETLRERLTHGAIPVRKAVDYGVQIAHGLAAAHERGIVHRDLKPENLFITKDERVKILDFGLAKLTQPNQEAGLDETMSPQGTEPGVILGTAGYMSPEQVHGRPADHRSDIFTFGAVLYEMVTGRRAFHRTSSIETMAVILNEDPSELSIAGERQIPPDLERIVRRCLEKKPEQRFQCAKDLGFALEGVNLEKSTPAKASPIARDTRWRTVSLALGALLLAALLLAATLFTRQSEKVQYRQITFRQGYITAARFSHDGQSVLYSAAWDGPVINIYSSRYDGSEVRALDLPSGDLLAVSRSGELAVALNGKVWMGLRGGRLAIAPTSGGAPRELLDQVGAADWAPDGANLAVAHFIKGKCFLEYPIGKPLYETIGSISHMRFSPQGDAIAFMDHPIRGDDRGSVVVVDLNGRSRALTREWDGEQGLAWSPDGTEILFTATSESDSDRSLYGVSRSGKLRLVLQAPGTLFLEDVASDGSILLRHDDRHYQVIASDLAGHLRKLSWLQIMMASSISRDGTLAVIGDWSTRMYAVYTVRTDGSSPVLLGDGIGGSISPDNHFVTSIPISDTSRVTLLPTGIGETRTISAPRFHYRSASWTRDGQELIVFASQSDRPPRFWVQNLDGTPPRAITPEGIEGLLITVNDSEYIAGRDSSGKVQLFPIDGSAPRPVQGISDGDQIVGGSPTLNMLYAATNYAAVPLQIVKVDIVTGKREPFFTISPPDTSGLAFLYPPLIADNERSYVYTQLRTFSELYLTSRVK